MQCFAVVVQHGADGICRVNIRSMLKFEELSPSVTLKSLVVPVRYMYMILNASILECSFLQ